MPGSPAPRPATAPGHSIDADFKGESNAAGPGAATQAESTTAAPAVDVRTTDAPAAPPACADPEAPAVTLDSVTPETPPLAAQQGISGIVVVVVSLDTASRVVAARVLKSPNALLDEAALRAARASTFRTGTHACRPVAADYSFIVEFTAN